MRYKVIALSIVFLLMNINSAIASGRHGRHYSNHHYGHHDSHYSYGYDSHHYSHYDDHGHGHNAVYALGGLIVGGILGATLTSSYNASRDNGYRRSNYTAPYTVNNVIRPSYMLQPNGECYLISHVSNGNMVLSPASTRNCE